MEGPIHDFLSRDHERLDRLLARAAAESGRVDMVPYAEFREGLLRHIAMEERVLLPAVREARGGDPHPLAERLHADHAALAALLVPTPTPAILATVRGILETHNHLEEGPSGPYLALLEEGGQVEEELLSRLRAQPEVKVAAHVDDARVHESIERLLRARAAL